MIFRRICKENEISRFVEDGAKLDRHLHARHIPMEQNDVFKARKAIEKQILQNSGGKPRFGEFGPRLIICYVLIRI